MAVEAGAVAPAVTVDRGGVHDQHLPRVKVLVLLGGDVDPVEEASQAVWKPDPLAIVTEAVSGTTLGGCTGTCDEDRLAILTGQTVFFVREAGEVLSQLFELLVRQDWNRSECHLV